MNAISSAASGNIDSLAVAATGPGLIRPDLLALASSGLALTATMPSPFAVLFGSGVLAFANGSTPGQFSDAATVSFSGLVPGSGSVTVYLVATAGAVNEGPFQVTGPPPGHPDYNPNFAAYTAYAQSLDTLLLAPTTTPPDGVASILLCSTLLTAGMSTLSTLSRAAQKLATPLPTQNFVNVVSNKALAATDAGILQRLTAPLFLTLPDVSVASRIFPFACRAAGCVIQTVSSGQVIYGFGGGAVNSIQPLNGQAGAFVSDGLTWQTVYLSDSNSANPIQGSAAGLVVTNVGGSSTQRNIGASSIVLQDGNGNARSFSGVNLTYSTGTSGPSGIFESLTPNSWLYEYVIYDASTNTLAAGADSSPTAPSLPSGFTFFALVSADWVDGSSNLRQTIKRGKRNQYVATPATNTLGPLILGNSSGGSVGNVSTPILVGVNVSGVVPLAIAASINLGLNTRDNNTQLIAAPNPNGGGFNSTTSPPPMQLGYEANDTVNNEFVLESASVYWATNGTGGLFFCQGWSDNF